MSERKYFAILTDIGQQKVSAFASGGEKVNITAFVVGDANGEYYTPTTDMTAIKNEVWRGVVSNADVVKDAQKVMRVSTVIPAEVNGFIVREMGLYDESGQLIAIGNTPPMPKVMLEEGVSTELNLSMRFAVKNTEALTFVTDPHTVIMTKDMLDTHNVDNHAHKELLDGKLDKTGGTITGNTTIQGNLKLKSSSSNYGNKINFGDGDDVHLYEVSDDKLEIKASNVDFVVSGNITKNGNTFGGKMTKNEIDNVMIGTGTGNSNTALGRNSLQNNTTGYNNTANGYCALQNNTTGYGNTANGYFALYDLTSYNHCTGLGYNAQVTGSNQVQLGDSSVTVYAQKALVTRSDERDKIDIEDSPLGLNFILQLRPRKYRMNSREAYFEKGQERDFTATNDGSKAGKRPHYGLIAQEVKEVMNELGVDFAGYLDSKVDGGEDVLSLGYTEFIAPMIKAIQEQQQMIKELQKQIEELKK